MARAGRGKRALAAAAAAALLCALALSGTSASAADPQPASLVAGAEESVLRLHDLPAGYVVDGNSFCGALTPREDDRRPLDRWIVKYRPAICSFEYDRYFQVPGLGPAPPVVTAEVINTPNETAAARGLAIGVRTFADEVEGKDRGTVAIPGGPPAQLFRIQDVVIDGRSRPGSLVLWRHGAKIAAIEVGGAKPQQNDRLALHFAEIQWGRLEAPSPYEEAERDDTEVPLEDPGLEVPVYWLGRRFSPQGLPPMNLLAADSSPTIYSPQAPVRFLYVGHLHHEQFEGLYVNLWSPSQWKQRRKGSRKLPGSLDCATAHRVKLAQGRAVAFHGWAEYDGSCRGPHHVWALRVHLSGVVVTAETAKICATCAEASTGPYSSYRGMAAIARSLALRSEPDL